jgi:hypothetical protein
MRTAFCQLKSIGCRMCEPPAQQGWVPTLIAKGVAGQPLLAVENEITHRNRGSRPAPLVAKHTTAHQGWASTLNVEGVAGQPPLAVENEITHGNRGSRPAPLVAKHTAAHQRVGFYPQRGGGSRPAPAGRRKQNHPSERG